MIGYDVGSPYAWFLRIDYYTDNQIIWYQETHAGSGVAPRIKKCVLTSTSSSNISY